MQTLDYIEHTCNWCGSVRWRIWRSSYLADLNLKDDLTSNWDTYPVLKFFKGNALVEFGYSDTSNWDIHLMYRF